MGLRQNLSLKIISLLASVLIYVYVQAERNPIETRPLIASVVARNVAPGLEVEFAQQQVEVSVTGPRPLLDRLKDGDVRAEADLKGIQPSEPQNTLARLTFVAPTLPPEVRRDLSFEARQQTLRVQVYPQRSVQIRVVPLYPKDPPAGFRYGRPDVSPTRVTVIGRADRLNKVSQVVVNAEPAEAGGSIAGDFPASARDTDNKPITDVVLQPDTVHVTISLVEEPAAKIVTVSATIPDQPLPPYKLTSVTVTPNQVKIIGRPAQVNQLFTLSTADIRARDLTETQEFEVSLNVPPDVVVRDVEGRQTLTRVSVRVAVSKIPTSPSSSTPPVSKPPTTTPPTLPPPSETRGE